MNQTNIRHSQKTDGVYVREAYNYHPQGTFIDQMREHASIEIANEDATTINCAIFTDFKSLCGLVSEISNIREDRVYPALRLIGYNRCYHEFKANGGDVFSEITKHVRQCKVSLDLDKMRIAQQQYQFFVDVHTKKYRVTKQMSEIAVKQAESCSINTSHLNLYHALHGVKILVENEPEYISLVAYPVIDDALRVLKRADKSLESRRKHLEVWSEI